MAALQNLSQYLTLNNLSLTYLRVSGPRIIRYILFNSKRERDGYERLLPAITFSVTNTGTEL